MAGSLADYAENKVLELIVGKTAFATPTVSVALYTVAPTDSTPGTECTGGSYARKVTSGSDWAAASGGAISNAAAITFVTATGSWGTAVAFALLDGSSNMLAWGDLTPNITVDSGETVEFAIGDLDITLD